MTTHVLTPHLHKDLIIAFALGYSIQYLCPTKGYWKDTTRPTWDLNTQYRVTP
jgi:hypothetical protein